MILYFSKEENLDERKAEYLMENFNRYIAILGIVLCLL